MARCPDECVEEEFRKLPRRPPIRFLNKLGDCELARAVNGTEEIELALGSLHLGDVHVKEADGVTLEALTLGFVPFDVR